MIQREVFKGRERRRARKREKKGKKKKYRALEYH
jgi:hypothetical protein